MGGNLVANNGNDIINIHQHFNYTSVHLKLGSYVCNIIVGSDITGICHMYIGKHKNPEPILLTQIT